jgi:hypothetical protein
LGVRVFLVAAAAGGAAFGVSREIGWHGAGSALIATLLALLVAGGVTFAGLFILRVEEFSEVLELVLGRFGRKRGGGNGSSPAEPSLEQA